MLIVWRRWYFAGVLGAGLAIHGAPELALALHTNSEPVTVALDELVARPEIENPYVRIGEHVAMHGSGTTFRTGYRVRKERCAYPIVAAGRAPDAAQPFHVFVLANGRLDRSPRVTAAGLSGIARPLTALGNPERRIIGALARGEDGVVVIERDRRPHLLVSLLEVLASAVFLAWAVSLFMSARKPPEGEARPR